MDGINKFILWPYKRNACGSSVHPRVVGLFSSRGGYHCILTPDYYCLHIVTKGRGVVRTPHGSRELLPGMMFVHWPGVLCEYYAKNGGEWDFNWLHAYGPGAAGFVKACGLDAAKPFLDKPFNPGGVEHAIHSIWRSLTLREGASTALALFFSIPSLCVENHQEPRPLEIVDEAAEIMTSMMHTGININEIADQLHVGRVSLFQSFRKRYKCSPGKYFEGLKIAKAKDFKKTLIYA